MSMYFLWEFYGVSIGVLWDSYGIYIYIYILYIHMFVFWFKRTSFGDVKENSFKKQMYMILISLLIIRCLLITKEMN